MQYRYIGDIKGERVEINIGESTQIIPDDQFRFLAIRDSAVISVVPENSWLSVDAISKSIITFNRDGIIQLERLRDGESKIFTLIDTKVDWPHETQIEYEKHVTPFFPG